MKKVSQPQRRRRDRVRKQLNLETLESRHLLATFLWDGGGVDDLWSNPQNWNTNSGFPNSAADEAVFDDSLVSISQYALLDIGLGGQRVEPGAIELSGTGNGGNSFNYTGLTSDTADSFGVTIGRQNTSGANIGGLDWRDRGNGNSNALVALGEDFVKNNQGIVRVDLDSIPAGRYQITSYHVDPDFNQSEAIQIHVDTGSGFVTQGVQGNSNFNNGAVAGLTTQEVIDSQAQFTIDATGGPISIVFDGSQATDLETPLSGLRIEAIGSVSGAMIDVDGNYETGTLRFDTDILSYDVAGAGTLTAGTVTNDGATGNLVSANLSASASGTITFNSASSQLAVVGNINGGSAQIAATGAGDIELNGDISNSTGLTKSDAGTTTLSGDNSYSGDTLVNGGTLLVASDTGLGGTADGTTVNTGAELGLLGNISVAEAVSINGSGAGAGSLINVADDNTLTGNVELVPASSGSLFTLVSANGRVAPEPLQVVAGGLVEDVDAYVDRTHEWNGATGTGIPSYLQGADIVQQANDDKAAGGYSIDLDFAQTVDLYVWIDNRFTSPATQFPWLGNLGFADTGDDLGIDEAGNGVGAGAGINQTLSIYRLTAHDGPITLGASLNANNMYGIAAVANGPAAANATIGAVAGSLTVEGNITHNQPASNVTFNSESNIVVNGAISAVDSIASTGSGNTTLAGVNTFAGPVDVQVGQLTAANSGALGTDAVGTTVWEGATLGLSGGVDIGAEALTLGGDLVNLSGDNTTSGAIRLTEEGNVPFAFFDISQNAGRVEPGYIPLFGNNNAQNNNSYSGLVSATGSTFDASLTNVDQAGATVGNLDYRDRGNGSNEPLIALGEDFVKNNGGIIRLTLTGLPAGDYVATSFHVDVDNTQSGQIEVHVDTGTGFANSGAVGDSNFSAGGAAGLTTAEMESNATQFDFTADGASDVVIVFDGRPHADDETPLAGLQLEFVETSSVNSITSDAGTLTVAGDISATAQQSTLTAGGSGNVAVTGAIASLSQLNKVGSGVTTLAGANGFDGEIEVTGGRLVAGSDTALGSNVGGVSVTAAELELTGGIDVGAENIALGDASSLLSSGGDNTIAGDIFTIGGTNTFDYVTLDIGENNQRVEPGAVALSGSGNGNANIDFNGLTADTGDTFGASLSNVNAAGVNSGGLDWRDRGDGNGDALVALGEDFIKNNLGIVRLTLSDLPAATYSAIAYHVDPTNNQSEAILVSVDTDGTGFGATLSTGNSNFNNGGVGGLTASEVEDSASVFSFTADGTNPVAILFDGSAAADDEAPLSGIYLQASVDVLSAVSIDASGGTLTLDGNVVLDFTDLTISGDGNVAANGVISEVRASQLIKTSTGIWTLGGDNVYAGDTDVQAGTLFVTNSTGSATGSGNLTLAANTVIGGNGSVFSDISVPATSTITPGINSADTLSTAALTLAVGAELVAELTAAATDQVDVTGTVDLGGATLTTSLENGYQPADNEVLLLINNDGVDVVTGTFVSLADGDTFELNNGTTNRLFEISYDYDVATSTDGTGNDVVLIHHNRAPVATVGGPYVINESDALNLDASGSSDPDSDSLTFSWDLNNDGTFGDATGDAISLTLNDLLLIDPNLGDGPNTLDIAVEVSDGELTTTGTATVSIVNVAPTATISGSNSGVPNLPIDFTVGATNEPSTLDEAAGFTYTINWMDGSPVETVGPGAANSEVVPHTFAEFGTFDIIVTAADKDGGTTSTSMTVQIDTVAESDPVAKIGDNIFVDGTDSVNDRIIIQVAREGEIFVRYNDQRYGPFETVPSSIVEVFGGDGNDRISVGGCIATEIHGEDGNDNIAGGQCNDTVWGGEGRDVIQVGEGDNLAYGGGGNDILVGRSGSDTLYGEGGNDELIGAAGRDFLFGGIGNDRFSAGNGSDLLVGGLGNDIMNGGSGADVILGGLGNDLLRGNNGHDLLLGGSGNDQLQAHRGDDLLSGGNAANEDDAEAQLATLLNWSVSHIHDSIGTLSDDTERDALSGGGNADDFYSGADDFLVDLRTADSEFSL